MREWQAWGLNRPLELFFDDGEYLGWCTHTHPRSLKTPARYLAIIEQKFRSDNNLAHALDEDPVLVEDYEKLQIPRMPWGQRDWMTCRSKIFSI